MTRENQKKLYDHFLELSKNGKTDKQRERATARAAALLKIYPDFDVQPAQPGKKPVKEGEPVSDKKPWNKMNGEERDAAREAKKAKKGVK